MGWWHIAWQREGPKRTYPEEAHMKVGIYARFSSEHQRETSIQTNIEIANDTPSAKAGPLSSSIRMKHAPAPSA